MAPPRGPEAACAGSSQTGHMAKRPHIGEIDLGGLDEPLPHIREVRAEHDHLVRRFEHRQPGLDRVDRDPDVPCDVGEIQELSAPGCQDLQEALESREIPDLPEGANISLEIGLDVTAMPQGDIALGMREGLRVSASQKRLPERPVGEAPGGSRGGCAYRFPRQGKIRAALCLAPGEREQAEHGGAAGQGFADVLRERQVL